MGLKSLMKYSQYVCPVTGMENFRTTDTSETFVYLHIPGNLSGVLYDIHFHQTAAQKIRSLHLVVMGTKTGHQNKKCQYLSNLSQWFINTENFCK